MKDYKCISITNSAKSNREIFDSLEFGEKFYIITTNRDLIGLYKYLCIRIKEDENRESFIHKSGL